MELRKRTRNFKLWNEVKSWGSFADLSFQTRIHPSDLSRIVNGFRPATEEQRAKICEILGKTASELGL